MTGSLADLIAPHLPYMRRFARALTGSQERGDAYVAAMLEALVADPSCLDRRAEPRIGLFRLLVRMWDSIPFNQSADAVEYRRDGAAERRIETLSPRARQAFLLASLEELQPADIAAVLDCTEDEASRLIDDAGREISSQLAARVLIIEDEPLIALDLDGLVSEIGHEVVGVARTRKEAGQLALSTNPGLVLADIQLADGSSGIDAVNDILSSINVPVIFITAYPERLLTGERAEPAFLVSKPFRPEMVKAVISQALFFDVKAGSPPPAAE